MLSTTHAPSKPLKRAAVAVALIALPIVGCAGSAASLPAATSAQKTVPRQTATTAAAHSTSTIAHLTKVAKRRYAMEVGGGQAKGTLHRVARDKALISALQSGDQARLRSYVTGEFNRVWYHWHVSRLRVVQGSKMLVDVGVPFVVAPSQTTLRDAHGRSLGTLQTSIQDVIGFVRYMHRNYPVDVVVRGSGAAHVRSSLPAATNANLPNSGTVTLGGTRYNVGSFTAKALGGESVRAWILQRG
jgi:hypothetical protein